MQTVKVMMMPAKLMMRMGKVLVEALEGPGGVLEGPGTATGDPAQSSRPKSLHEVTSLRSVRSPWDPCRGAAMLALGAST